MNTVRCYLCSDIRWQVDSQLTNKSVRLINDIGKLRIVICLRVSTIRVPIYYKTVANKTSPEIISALTSLKSI